MYAIPEAMLDHQVVVDEQADAHRPIREMVFERKALYPLKLRYLGAELGFEPHVVVAEAPPELGSLGGCFLDFIETGLNCLELFLHRGKANPRCFRKSGDRRAVEQITVQNDQGWLDFRKQLY